MEEGRTARRPRLNVLLFVITCLSAFFVGLTWSVSYTYAEEIASSSHFHLGVSVFAEPRIIRLTFAYTVVLIGILLGHEMGHYLTCRRYRISATLPYFIPAPTMIGTLGAFIKIKSPITRKVHLFDVGASGPLTGFVLSLPALIYGLSLSRVISSFPREATYTFGEPLLLKGIAGLMFSHVPEGSELLLHPIGFAGWVGVLLTALNLFPVGQLDGGHISYALIGQKAQLLARLLIGLFFVMGVFFWVGWVIWALAIMLLGLKHPRVVDEEERLPSSRRLLGAVVAIIFVLSFIPAPIKGYSLLELLRQWGL